MKRIPIIVLTGDPSENERNKCINILKANAFLTKPICMGEFTMQLRKVIKMEEEKEEEGEPLITQRRLVILVEDDKLLSNLMKMFLTNYNVIQAYSIKEVLIYIYIYSHIL